MKPYRFLEEADAEFQEHITYYDEQAPGLGDKYIAYVDRAIRSDEIIIVAIAPHKRRPGYWRKRLRTLR